MWLSAAACAHLGRAGLDERRREAVLQALPLLLHLLEQLRALGLPGLLHLRQLPQLRPRQHQLKLQLLLGGRARLCQGAAWSAVGSAARLLCQGHCQLGL